MTTDTIERIEEKIAFLERATLDLSDVVFRQDREIQALTARVKALAERLDTAGSEERSRAPEDERPPHY